MEILALILGFGLLARFMWNQQLEIERIRAELTDTELANAGLTEELDAYRDEAESPGLAPVVVRLH